ncbi:MAG: epoxyqueuosine reductase [Deferribacterales bacterium]
MHKEEIIDFICLFVKKHAETHVTAWGEPLVGFADAYHPEIQNLKNRISPDHGLPQEVLPDAKTVIVYFVPFTKELADTNRHLGELASPEWALAYEETNAMFIELNAALIKELASAGINGRVAPQTSTFDTEKLISGWSHRHFAWAAGLGTFGINNMLITKKGCCGRYNSIVTNFETEHGKPLTKENCLYKRNRKCGACMKRCPSGALTPDGFARHKCQEILLKNAAIYNNFGTSYTDSDGNAVSSGSDVCGKCVAGVPCSFTSL